MFGILTLMAVTVMTAGARGEWPLPRRDVTLSGRADVACAMPGPPCLAWSYDLGSVPPEWAVCADVNNDGRVEVISGPAPLLCADLRGRELWRYAGSGVVAVADVDQDGRTEVVVEGPAVLDGQTGRVLWRRAGAGVVTRNNTHVARLLPSLRGLQIACVAYDHETRVAQVWRFDEGCGNAALVWERRFNTTPMLDQSSSAVGPFDRERMCVVSAVYGGVVALDAADGSDLYRLYWEAAPGLRSVRNYGLIAVQDLDGDGASEFVLLNGTIALQAVVISPARHPAGLVTSYEHSMPGPDAHPGELARYDDGPILWRRHFGDWYPTGPYLLHFPTAPIVDVTGDGRCELIVSVHRERWELKAYDALRGVETASVPDMYVLGALDIDRDGTTEIIASREPERTPREFTGVVVGSLRGGSWRPLWEGGDCRLETTTHLLWPPHSAAFRWDERTPLSVEERGRCWSRATALATVARMSCCACAARREEASWPRWRRWMAHWTCAPSPSPAAR